MFINIKTIPLKKDIKSKEPGFLTFIMPIAGNRENCKPKHNSIIPKRGMLATKGIKAPLRSIMALIIAKKTMSFILNLLKILSSSF